MDIRFSRIAYWGKICILEHVTREQLKKMNLPDEPGVYIFKDESGLIMYIGKAASLRDRVRSYFARDLAETRGPAIAAMIEKIATIDWERTDSVLEALIHEANLIKKHQPPLNVDEKDNKSFNYLVITKEEFPRVLVVRGRELFQKWQEKDIKYCFGPYPHGGALQEAVRLVRKIFPYRDSRCVPCEKQREAKKTPQLTRLSLADFRCKPCFNRQIGMCPGVCTGEISKTEYAETMRNIKELFSGGMRSLKQRLESDMRNASAAEDFEHAEKLRRQVAALTHIRDVSLLKEEHRISAGGSFRIEAYDVAHTSGKETVGVMTVVESGEPYKSDYRMFKIKTATNDDTKALSEILERRLAHSEWRYPRIIAVDGGKGQRNAAARVLKRAGISIPIIAVVKNEFHRPERLIGDERLIRAYEKDVLLANDEAHRFAITFHRKRARRRMI